MTSSVFVEPNQCSSQMSVMRSSRRSALPGDLGEAREQVELLRPELDIGAGHDRSARGAIDDQLADHDAVVVVRDPAQVGAHARRELREPKRLGDVVDRAAVEPDDHVDLGVARRQDDDRERGLLREERPADVDAVPVGKSEIEQHEVGRLLARHRPRRRRGAGPRRPWCVSDEKARWRFAPMPSSSSTIRMWASLRTTSSVERRISENEGGAAEPAGFAAILPARAQAVTSSAYARESDRPEKVLSH